MLVEAEQADLAAALLMADEVESAFAGHRLAMAGPNAAGDIDFSADDIFGFPADDLDDPRRHRQAVRLLETPRPSCGRSGGGRRRAPLGPLDRPVASPSEPGPGEPGLGEI